MMTVKDGKQHSLEKEKSTCNKLRGVCIVAY